VQVYRWLLYVHIASVLGFVLLHGMSTGMLLSLRSPQSAEATALRQQSTTWRFGSYGFLGVVVLTGVALGVQGNWWRYGWIWAAIVIVVAAVLALGAIGIRLRRTRSRVRVWLISIIGMVGLLLLLWLMVLKPF